MARERRERERKKERKERKRKERREKEKESLHQDSFFISKDYLVSFALPEETPPACRCREMVRRAICENQNNESSTAIASKNAVWVNGNKEVDTPIELLLWVDMGPASHDTAAGGRRSV